MNSKPGFVSVTVAAKDMILRGYAFDVVLDGDQVKAYATDKDTWSKVEADLYGHLADWDQRTAKPLVVSSGDFLDTASQMGWIVVRSKGAKQ